ncbi:copper-binding protein [Vibrio cincinnatiensis]|uniref:copper-resistant cuproprotein CopI n=1 Tax=Vibrio cincinnatiensis TaxID=675 RepID=UPI001EDD6C3E|nr:copper-binding protein [Vibrio cincinnatiensis]MCG3743653.1 copper-binding protein [Vibrio cincinnatiensis]
MKTILLTITLALSANTAYAAKTEHAHQAHGKASHHSMEHNNIKMDHSKMAGMTEMSEVGMPAKGAKPDKVVHVILSDDRKITFKREVTIEPNDVVQFVIMNTGKIDHEFAIGSAKEQLEHRQMMRTMTMHHDHDSGRAVTVAPGKAKQLLWHFHGERKVELACNLPGHAEAGMVKHIQL